MSGSVYRVTIMHVNMQGINSKLNELECFMMDSKVDLDFVCISEHWLNHNDLCDGLPLARWDVAAYFARRTHIRGGVLIYTKKKVTCKALDLVNALSCELNCEMVSVLCELYRVSFF